MHTTVSFLILLVCLLTHTHATTGVDWTQIDGVRAGQIETITQLRSSIHTDPSLTHHSATFFTSLSANATNTTLQCATSLSSFESWMTSYWHYNISIHQCSATGVTVSMILYDVTYFTNAKVHYLVIWRGDPNLGTGSAWHDIEVIPGCYYTNALIIRPGDFNRNQTVSSVRLSAIATNNPSAVHNLVVKVMLTGLQLYNVLGLHQTTKITATFNPSDTRYLDYLVEVGKNNYVTYVCVSTVIMNPLQPISKYRYIIEQQSYDLTSMNRGLKDIQYAKRFDGLNRMFFGFSQFNFTMSDARQLLVQASNISLIAPLYIRNYALNLIAYHTFFMAKRVCKAATPYYYPIDYSCVANCSIASILNINASLCDPCHYSCLTCSQPNSHTQCSSCQPTNLRNPVSANTCTCVSGYVDLGVSLCGPCNQTLTGCIVCSSATVCTTCDPSPGLNYMVNSTGKCVCIGGYFMASPGYCLSYPGCTLAQYYNNIVSCKACDNSRNFILWPSNDSCICNFGYFINSTSNSTNSRCQDICGDGIAAIGKCDDGNLDPFDGCDQFCDVQNGFHCVNNFTNNGTRPGISVCYQKKNMKIKYLYSQRMIATNEFVMAFSVTPPQQGLHADSFDLQFLTSLPVIKPDITFNTQKSIIYMRGQYRQDIEGRSHSGNISFNNMSFYADYLPFNFQPKGLNARLVIEQYAHTNNILSYVIMAVTLLALLISIFSSVVGLKLAGIQLLIPIQLIYFSLACIDSRSSFMSWFSQLKHSNGYNSLIPYEVDRTYSQRINLIGIQFETQFLLSTNIFAALYFFALGWLCVHHLLIKYKENKLQSFLEQNDQDGAMEELKAQEQAQQQAGEEREESDQQRQLMRRKAAVEKDQDLAYEQNAIRQDHHYSFKIFTFQVDRVYFTIYFIMFNQIMFSFIIMSSNVPIAEFIYSQALSILACNFLLFIFVGNTVFFYNDQQSNKVITFTCIRDRYAYLYFIINATIIMFIGLAFQQEWSIYCVTPFSALFILLIVLEKPYSSTFFSFQNIVALYTHIVLTFSLILFCIINAEAESTEQAKLSFSYIILILIFIGQVLTCIRVYLKVNLRKAFDDLKRPHSDQDDADEKKKRVIEKNLDLLYEQEQVQIIPPDSVRNGLLTPKDRMIDWQSKNTDDFESIKQKESTGASNQEQKEENEDDNKLTQLQILKRKLRNNLKMKKERESEETKNKND